MTENSFTWADGFVVDVAYAKEFYKNLFGWHFVQQHAEHGVVYSLACMDASASPPESTSVAGLAECPDPQRKMNFWNCYINVASVDDAVKQVLNAKGFVYMEPMDVMTAGRMAVCADSHGVVFHLWEPIDHFGFQIKNQSNSTCWFELAVTDLSKAAEFYAEVFSWSVTYRKMPWGKYGLFSNDDGLVCGAHDQINQTQGVECWLPYFQTEDLDESLRICRKFKGGAVYGPKQEPEMGRYAIATDCEKNMFGLAEFGDSSN